MGPLGKVGFPCWRPSSAKLGTNALGCPPPVRVSIKLFATAPAYVAAKFFLLFRSSAKKAV